jgi:hypothetical protein
MQKALPSRKERVEREDQALNLTGLASLQQHQHRDSAGVGAG